VPPCHGDVRSVALHEFGHLVMLAHSSRTGDIMYENLPIGASKRTLATHDKEMMWSMYPPK